MSSCRCLNIMVTALKSGYQAIQQWKANHVVPTSSNILNPRHKTILWRILNNALPIRSELEKRGIFCSPLYPRCNSKVETLDHIFMNCCHIYKTWFGSKLNIKILDQPITNFFDWLALSILHPDTEVMIQIAAIIYNIWFARNQSIFEEKSINEFQHANFLPQDHSNTLLRSDSTSNRRFLPNWKKPDAGLVKANCDASLSTPGWWGLGCIIRDSQELLRLGKFKVTMMF